MVEGEDEYGALARSLSRTEFSARCSCFLLVGKPTMQRPEAPGRTGFFEPKKMLAEQQAAAAAEAQLIVRAIKKTQEAFANMITVGRTANNDIQLHDTRVSRFHAFFRHMGDKLELSDAGSRHGTFVDGQKLRPKGSALPTPPGALIQFGQLEFTLCDAGTCWDLVRKKS